MQKLYIICTLILSTWITLSFQAAAVGSQETLSDIKEHNTYHHCAGNTLKPFENLQQSIDNDDVSRLHLNTKAPDIWTHTEPSNLNSKTRILIVPTTTYHLLTTFSYLYSAVNSPELHNISTLRDDEIKELITERVSDYKQTMPGFLEKFTFHHRFKKYMSSNLGSNIPTRLIRDYLYSLEELYIFKFIKPFEKDDINDPSLLCIRGSHFGSFSSNVDEYLRRFEAGFSLDLDKFQQSLGQNFHLIDSSIDDWQKDWPNSSGFRMNIENREYDFYFPTLWTNSSTLPFFFPGEDEPASTEFISKTFNTPQIFTAFQDRPLHAVWNISNQISQITKSYPGRCKKTDIIDNHDVEWSQDNIEYLQANVGTISKFEDLWEGRSLFYPGKNTFNLSLESGNSFDYYQKKNHNGLGHRNSFDFSAESKQRALYSDFSAMRMLLEESREMTPFTWRDVIPEKKCHTFDFENYKKGRCRWAVEKGEDLDRGIKLTTPNIDIDTYPKSEVQGWKKVKRGMLSSLGLSLGFTKKDPNKISNYYKNDDIEIVRHAHRIQIRSDIGFSKYEFLVNTDPKAKNQESFFIESKQVLENGLIKEINFILDPDFEFYFKPIYNGSFEYYNFGVDTDDFFKINHFNVESTGSSSNTLFKSSSIKAHSLSLDTIQNPHLLIRQASSILKDHNIFDFIYKNGHYQFKNNQGLSDKAVAILDETQY